MPPPPIPLHSHKTLVLFVHGLGGDGTKTWGRFPELLLADPELKTRIDVELFQYPTQLIRWPFQKRSVRIQDLAAGIRTEIDVRYKWYDRIILVCHSMGGLIAQKYITDEVKSDRPRKIRALALYAVPRSGADLARWGSLISWKHWHLKQLRKGSDLLREIQDDWDRLRCSSTIDTCSVAGGQDAVVSAQTKSTSHQMALSV